MYPTSVILNAVKNLALNCGKILRFTQDDRGMCDALDKRDAEGVVPYESMNNEW